MYPLSGTKGSSVQFADYVGKRTNTNSLHSISLKDSRTRIVPNSLIRWFKRGIDIHPQKYRLWGEAAMPRITTGIHSASGTWTSQDGLLYNFGVY